MKLYTADTTLALWQHVVEHAKTDCAVYLPTDLEVYLVSLLIRYTTKPEIAKQILATAFLEALQLDRHEKQVSLQRVGDECLVFAGLFPQTAKKKHVKLTYFVDLGRSAYAGISEHANDLFGKLAAEFVNLMDILQAISTRQPLLPLEAYEQWQALGSRRAYKALKEYTVNGIYPLSKPKQS